jgi:hypothetical protein
MNWVPLPRNNTELSAIIFCVVNLTEEKSLCVQRDLRDHDIGTQQMLKIQSSTQNYWVFGLFPSSGDHASD